MLQKIHITSLHRENKEHISKKHLYLNILWKNNCTPFEIVIQPNNYFSVISWTILEFPSVVLLHSILWNCISITRTQYLHEYQFIFLEVRALLGQYQIYTSKTVSEASLKYWAKFLETKKMVVDKDMMCTCSYLKLGRWWNIPVPPIHVQKNSFLCISS